MVNVKKNGTTVIIVKKRIIRMKSRGQRPEGRKIIEGYNKTILNSGYLETTSTKIVIKQKKWWKYQICFFNPVLVITELSW